MEIKKYSIIKLTYSISEARILKPTSPEVRSRSNIVNATMFALIRALFSTLPTVGHLVFGQASRP